MKEKDLPIDLTKHKVYSKNAKKCVQKLLRRYYDENTNKWVDKALVIVDGKVLNPEGFYLITKA